MSWKFEVNSTWRKPKYVRNPWSLFLAFGFFIFSWKKDKLLREDIGMMFEKMNRPDSPLRKLADLHRERG